MKRVAELLNSINKKRGTKLVVTLYEDLTGGVYDYSDEKHSFFYFYSEDELLEKLGALNEDSLAAHH